MFTMLFDLLIVFVLVWAIVAGVRKGFARNCVKLAGALVICFITLIFAKPVGYLLYDKYYEAQYVDEFAVRVAQTQNIEAKDAADAFAQLDLHTLFIQPAEIMADVLAPYGVSTEEVKNIVLDQYTSGQVAGTTEQDYKLAQSIVKDAAMDMSWFVACLVLLLAGILLWWLIGWLLCGVMFTSLEIVPLKGWSKAGGALVSVLAMLVVAMIFAYVMDIGVAILAQRGWIGFSADTIDNTLIFKYLVQVNPLL